MLMHGSMLDVLAGHFPSFRLTPGIWKCQHPSNGYATAFSHGQTCSVHLLSSSRTSRLAQLMQMSLQDCKKYPTVLVSTMELIVRKAMVEDGSNPSQLVCLVQVGDVSLIHTVQIMSIGARLATALEQNYPGRLHKLYVLDLPISAQWFFNFVLRFVKPETRQKVIRCASTSPEVPTKFSRTGGSRLSSNRKKRALSRAARSRRERSATTAHLLSGGRSSLQTAETAGSDGASPAEVLQTWQVPSGLSHALVPSASYGRRVPSWVWHHTWHDAERSARQSEA
jgi:hypothetical protein